MLDTCKFLTACRIPNSCSATRCQTCYYNDHSGIPVFQMPSTQESIDKWRRFLHREGKFTILQILSLCSTHSFLCSIIEMHNFICVIFRYRYTKILYFCVKHLDTEDLQDKQMYLNIDGVYKSRRIKDTLKKRAIKKYLPDCPSSLSV